MKDNIAELLPSSGAGGEVWTRSDSGIPGCTFGLAPPDVYGWWSGAPWLDKGFGHFSNTRQCTRMKKTRERQQGGTDGEIFSLFTGTAISQLTHRYFPVF